MKKYTDFKGVSHIVGSDTELTQIMRSEILELRMQLYEKDQNIKELDSKVDLLKDFINELKQKKEGS